MFRNRFALRLLSGGACLYLSALCFAQSAKERKALEGTVSIGDTLDALDSAATKTPIEIQTVSTDSKPTKVILTNAKPVHLLYVHGISEVGPNDSKFLREGICKLRKECHDDASEPKYAEGPFALGSARSVLEYLGRPVWSSDEQWSASAPYLVRHRITGNGKPPIILDEVNWYPLVYPMKCKFLLPGDRKLTGQTKAQDDICEAATKEDPHSPKRFLAYKWDADPELFRVDMPQQKATLLNGKVLKSGVLDWGFGDAALALGPMQEVICAGIRQLFAQSLKEVAVDEQGKPLPNLSDDDIPVYIVTHSLGSYLSLAAMDAEWDHPSSTDMAEFAPTPEQMTAAQHFTEQTAGFYFLANQLALLQLAHLSTPSSKGQGSGPVSPDEALSHLASRSKKKIQIIAWSAADDLLSWYVPKLEKIRVVNLPARNSSFRIPWLVAGPQGVHDNYAKNKKVLRVIFAGKAGSKGAPS